MILLINHFISLINETMIINDMGFLLIFYFTVNNKVRIVQPVMLINKINYINYQVNIKSISVICSVAANELE